MQCCFGAPTRWHHVSEWWPDPPGHLPLLLAPYGDIYLARGTGFMQKNSGWRSCISWHPGAAKLHLPLLPSVSQTNLCFEWNLPCLLKASMKWLFKFLSNVGVENLRCGFGWRDHVRKGLREWVTWTQGEVYSGLRGGALRWPWGHTDSGRRRRVLGDTLPFVRKMYLVRQKCNMVHSVLECDLRSQDVNLFNPNSCRVSPSWGHLPDRTGSHDRRLHSDPHPAPSRGPTHWPAYSGGQSLPVLCANRSSSAEIQQWNTSPTTCMGRAIQTNYYKAEERHLLNCC